MRSAPPPEGSAGPPPENHLRKGFHEIEHTPEAMLQDTIRLVNRVLLHTCSSYCAQKKKDGEGNVTVTCRFQYDDPYFMRVCECPCHAEERTAEDILAGKHRHCPECDNHAPLAPTVAVSGEDGEGAPRRMCPGCHWKIELDRREKWCLLAPRDHPRLVAYMSWFIAGVRANVDSQFILDQGALVNYILKYQTKAEKKSALFNKVRQLSVEIPFQRDLRSRFSGILFCFVFFACDPVSAGYSERRLMPSWLQTTYFVAVCANHVDVQ